jgi:hypothetical protein
MLILMGWVVPWGFILTVGALVLIAGTINR